MFLFLGLFIKPFVVQKNSALTQCRPKTKTKPGPWGITLMWLFTFVVITQEDQTEGPEVAGRWVGGGGRLDKSVIISTQSRPKTQTPPGPGMFCYGSCFSCFDFYVVSRIIEQPFQSHHADHPGPRVWSPPSSPSARAPPSSWRRPTASPRLSWSDKNLTNTSPNIQVFCLNINIKFFWRYYVFRVLVSFFEALSVTWGIEGHTGSIKGGESNNPPPPGLHGNKGAKVREWFKSKTPTHSDWRWGARGRLCISPPQKLELCNKTFFWPDEVNGVCSRAFFITFSSTILPEVGTSSPITRNIAKN